LVYVKHMIKPKKIRSQTIKSKFEKRDILTEMFEEFGIKVIDVSSQNSTPKSKKETEKEIGRSVVSKKNYLKKPESQKRLL